MSTPELNELFALLRDVRATQQSQVGTLATLSANLATTTMQVTKLENTIAVWMSDGCPMGKQHEREIQELKGAPAKALGTVATIGTIMGLLGAALIWVIQSVVHTATHVASTGAKP